MNSATIWILAAYVVCYFATIAALLLWRKRNRKDRKPFPDQLKLLRGPGESQREFIAKLDEKLDYYLIAGGVLPVLVAALLVILVNKLQGAAVFAGLAITLVVFLGLMWWSARWL